MKNWSLAIILILTLSLAAGCGKTKYEAQAINEDVDVCVVCNMQVKDDAFATQVITKDGKSLKFDDLGCMNSWKQENGVDNIGMDYVRDYNDKEWIEFDKATYVYDASIRTPMAYGVVSFKDKASAEAFAKEQGVGQILSAAELANHSWQQNQDIMDHHDHGEHGAHEGQGVHEDHEDHEEHQEHQEHQEHGTHEEQGVQEEHGDAHGEEAEHGGGEHHGDKHDAAHDEA